MKTHVIQISEPWDFEHQNGTNIFGATAIGDAIGPDIPNWDKKFLILNVNEPFTFKGELVSQILCSPRYEGDTLFLVKHLMCTVGISRVKPGTVLKHGSKISPEQVHYFAIGEITAHNKSFKFIRSLCSLMGRREKRGAP